jgi:predicted GNAT family acetyltransferase
MEADRAAVSVVDNPGRHRFETRVGEYLAVAEYHRNGGTITFTHTEVPAPLEGRGIASQLAHTALEQAKAEGLTVIPLCPFIAAYIRRHAEYGALVPPAYRHARQPRGERE